MEKLRVAMGLSSLVTSLFAASPLVDGKPSGYQSYRARAWLDTDPDRCGLLPFALRRGRALPRLRRVGARRADVLRLPRRRVPPRRRHDLPRASCATAGRASAPRMADWELHLSTLFPEVRLKTFIEVRQADASSREMVRALPALWRGVLYDAEARRAAWTLVADWSFDERCACGARRRRRACTAPRTGGRCASCCRELVAIARAGLERLGAADEAALLAPLERIVGHGPHAGRRDHRRARARRRRHRRDDRLPAPALSRVAPLVRRRCARSSSTAAPTAAPAPRPSSASAASAA